MSTATMTRPWLRSWPPDVPSSRAYPSRPAWWILEKNLDRFADRTAIQVLDSQTGEPGACLTYGDLASWARRLAGRLRRAGVHSGDRVALSIANGPDLIAAYHAIWLVGATAVPCDSMAAEPELRHLVQDARASLVLATGQSVEVAGRVASQLGIPLLTDLHTDDAPLAEPAPVDPNRDLALLMYTGGTTGDPKGAMLTHANVVTNTIQFSDWYRLEPGAETYISVLPLFHIGGLAGAMNVPLLNGATLLVLERFDPAVVARAIGHWRATRFFGVPTMYVGILNDPEARAADLSSLRACRTSAAPLPPTVKAAFDELVGHEVLVEGYGLSEASPLTHANPIGQAKAGSIGIPIADTDARVVDDDGRDVPPGAEGELQVQGPQVMRGYWRQPEQTDEALHDGWLHTGDVARMDEDGYFFIVDRKKDAIISGGFKIWPREVEEALYRHPAVALAAVVGIPDAYRGEAVKAFVQLKADQRASIDADDLPGFVEHQLAPYKVPRQIEIVDRLPMTVRGKVLKRELRNGRP